MTPFEAALLGLVQGLTEFLPVSSSGHLVIAQELLGVNTPGLAFEVWLHLATLVAVVVALWRDLLGLVTGLLPSASPDDLRDSVRTWLALILGTIPAVIIGLGLGDAIENAFQSLAAVGIGLLITAVVLFSSRFLTERDRPLTLGRAIIIGTAQAMAIFPGVSRSGSTLTAGVAVGLSGVAAARFSFLLALPAILGAAVLEAGSLADLGQTASAALGAGFLAALVSGYFAIRLVWRVMERGRLWMFAPYCALVGTVVLILAFR